MKKNRLAAGVLALAVSITASGCGTQVYELTEEEEAVIVHYSAHAVTKFNKRQPEGILNVAALKVRMEEREKRREEEKQQQEQEEQQKPAVDEKQDTPAGTPQDGSGEQPQEEQVNYVSLSQALQLGGVDAVYRGHEITAAYTESSSYMVRADSGNELLVLHVSLKNAGSSKAKCDILSKMPSFRLTVNDELSVTADTSILLNDLGTYQGNIKAGDTAETVLLFQVKEGTVKKIKSMDLEVTTGGTSSLVQLAAD